MNTSLSTIRQIEVRIPCHGTELEGDLVIPAGAEGLVLFAHGSGSSRLSPRNRFVAGEIHREGVATLLFDLLTPQEAVAEARTGALRFDIPFLTRRLMNATRWAQQDQQVMGMVSPRIGYFGSSTGAAAALAAAAVIPEIKAVVSRGGRTDLAGSSVEMVKAATLLIVGGLDFQVKEWNHQTFEHLTGVKEVAIIPYATHLFEEEGALEKVAELAASWFRFHLATPRVG